MTADEHPGRPIEPQAAHDAESAPVLWESVLSEARAALRDSWPPDLSPRKGPAEFQAALAVYRAEMRKYGIIVESRTNQGGQRENA